MGHACELENMYMNDLYYVIASRERIRITDDRQHSISKQSSFLRDEQQMNQHNYDQFSLISYI